MSKIANNKENYKSRSNKVSITVIPKIGDENTPNSREDYKIDCNGYFVWNSNGSSEKVKVGHSH